VSDFLPGVKKEHVEEDPNLRLQVLQTTIIIFLMDLISFEAKIKQ